MKKNTLYFRDSHGESRVVTTNLNTMKEVMRHILIFIADINPYYQIHYTRRWTDDDDNIWFDVGSHTEFFVLKGEAPENEQEAQEINTSPTEAERKRLYYRPE
jgi:hypothetical protein